MMKLSELKDQVGTSGGSIPKDSNEKERHGIKCKFCEKTFAQTCHLEIHINEHDTEKKYKCSRWGKTFHIEWRRNKHEENHNEMHIKKMSWF